MFTQIINNLRDIRVLGLGFAMRHLRMNNAAHSFYLKNVGRITIRKGGSDAQVIRQIFREGEYDLRRAGAGFSRLNNRYHEILAEGDIPLIVDAGANIGASALWFNKFYPKANIIAIEPDPENYACLMANTASIDLIKPCYAALGGKPGKASVSSQGQSWALQTARSDQGDIDILTIPQIFSDAGPRQIPLLVKIDIEGFESDVFEGVTDWIDNVPGLIIEPHDWLLPEKRSSKSFQREMGKRDFQLFISGENLIYIR